MLSNPLSRRADKTCGGRVVVESFDSRVLAGNRPQDPVRRNVPVYLPPSYDTCNRRYPTIYMLAGYSGTGLSYLNTQWRSRSLPEQLDALINSGRMEESIVVMADGMTRYGGSQYINSPATGRYQDFVAEETVQHIDVQFRTIPCRDARAVVGKSSGGYGALRLGMDRPDVFCAVACHSGDIYFEYCYFPTLPVAASSIARHGSLPAFLEQFESQPRLRQADFDAINTIASAAAYASASDGEGDGLGFLLPFDPVSGELRPDVWAHWLTQDPLRLCGHHVADLRSLRVLFIDVGSTDEYFLHLGGRLFHQRLLQLKVPHRYEEFEDGHRGTSYRYDVSLPALRKVLVSE